MQPFRPNEINWQPLTQVNGGSSISVPRSPAYDTPLWRSIAPPRYWASVQATRNGDEPTQYGPTLELDSRRIYAKRTYDMVLVGPPEGEIFEIENETYEQWIPVGKWQAPLCVPSLHSILKSSALQGFVAGGANFLQAVVTIGPINMMLSGPSEKGRWFFELRQSSVNLLSSPFEFAEYRESVTGLFGSFDDGRITYERDGSSAYTAAGNRKLVLSNARDGIFENGYNTIRRTYGISFQPLISMSHADATEEGHYEFELETEILDVKFFSAIQPE